MFARYICTCVHRNAIDGSLIPQYRPLNGCSGEDEGAVFRVQDVGVVYVVPIASMNVQALVVVARGSVLGGGGEGDSRRGCFCV
ncbi:hypothetical protein CBR_g45722 [Chara braunii]|uniref:Uncharacterized protein n=1 Tax=Chara braunii TaxID=69332 RepID=A0A388K3P5_CHABU|nr:hypothetical protein CBR_g45722 [Chara braunii]|eukprot:GBG64667.1 hypothetical protein CBR_g45722 [Chara braunii]